MHYLPIPALLVHVRPRVTERLAGEKPCIGILQWDVTRDNLQRRFVTQPFVAILEQYCRHSNQCRSNVAKLCWAKTRRYESSRVTSSLYHHASRSCLCLLDRGEVTPETRQALKLPKLELLGNSIVFSLFKVLFLERASVC